MNIFTNYNNSVIKTWIQTPRDHPFNKFTKSNEYKHQKYKPIVQGVHVRVFTDRHMAVQE